MANYGQPNVIISIGSASGAAAGALKDISQYVDTFNGVNIEAILQQSDAFGDSWVEQLYTGVRRINPVTLEGFYNDVAASGPHALMGQTSDLGADRLFEVDFGSSDIVQCRMIITNYNRMPRRGELTRFSVTLTPTGAVTTAT